MTFVPAFKTFSTSKEHYSSYLARFEQHFAAHGVTDISEKKAKLLSWVGTESFNLLGKINPEFETDLSFEEIRLALSNYSEQEMHFIHARVEFSRCNLKPQQTYKEWVVELRSIAKRCKF